MISSNRSFGPLKDLADTLIGRLTSTRAGYLDHLNTLVGRLTSTRAGYLDHLNTLVGRLTSTRAGYLDKLNTGVPSSIKSIQHGLLDLTGTSNTLTITAVDRAKTTVINQGHYISGAPSTLNTHQELAGSAFVGLTINAAGTNVRANRGFNLGVATVRFTVVEFY